MFPIQGGVRHKISATLH